MKYIVFSELTHIGTLDPSQAMKRLSFEGRGLSVSTVPGAWQQIARLSGPWWQLKREDSRFIEAHDPATRAELEHLALQAGLLAMATTWRFSWFDEELDAKCFCDYPSLARLLAEHAEEQGVVPAGVSQLEALVATPQLVDRYPLVSAGDYHATDIAFVELIELGLVDAEGIYWDEKLDVARLSAPRGAIAPSRLGHWVASAHPR